MEFKITEKYLAISLGLMLVQMGGLLSRIIVLERNNPLGINWVFGLAFLTAVFAVLSLAKKESGGGTAVLFFELIVVYAVTMGLGG
jgi:hypothetical protein